jgi:hypothetical protein
MDFLIFLVLAGVALAFRWLTKQAAEQSEKNSSSEPNERPVRPPSESEEERVRRFLEALGVPPGTKPPTHQTTLRSAASAGDTTSAPAESATILGPTFAAVGDDSRRTGSTAAGRSRSSGTATFG